jgi:hypothetical protein
MRKTSYSNLDGRAVLIAGLGGGTLFLLTILLFTPVVLGVDASLVLRYFASLVQGSDVLTDGNSTVLVVGVIVHYVLSVLFALLIAIVIHRWGLLIGILGGALMGLAIYAFNYYTMTLFFPWFFAVNNIVLLVGNMVYGAVTGGIYEVFDHYDVPFGTTVTQEVQP